MDCNKDDAIKAKGIAERKFSAKDIAGAKKFALKAHSLYPGLEGISQMLATLDVYLSAENQLHGEADWYGILGVNPRADDDTVRKQYRKLALMLHPDKNKSIGAEGAFKFISEAWSLLSDKNKRAAYDAKRNAEVLPPKAKSPSENSSMPPGSNGFFNFAKTATSNAKVNKHSSHANGSSASAATNKAHRSTFWTVCHRCKMQYEYLRTYLNHNLLCPNCNQPFFAIETSPPVSNGSRSSKPWNSAPQFSHQEPRNKTSPNVGHDTGNFQWTPFSGAAGASSVAQAANVVQQMYEKVKKVREEAQAARKREKAGKRKSFVSENMTGSSVEKKRRVSEDMGINRNQMGHGAVGSGMVRHGNPDSIQTSRASRFNSNRELTQVELRNILMFKARNEISKKIGEWSSATIVGNAAQKGRVMEKAVGKDKTINVEVNGDLHDQESNRASDTVNADKMSQNATDSAAAKEMLDKLSIPVPDPDFYDFDKDRTERAFGDNQVWAVYDNDDGMPRYYAMIHSVISRGPFRVRISWLNSKTNTELGPLGWAGAGFSKTCGDFRQGRHETYDSLNCFSHKVKWTKGTRGFIRIFPRKGDVWALYRNWSPDWDEFTSGEVRCKYEMVEVLEDYDEQLGVVAIPLVKVAGFKAVFHQHLNPKQARRIPKEEVFRFSYQIPSHLISGHEAPNAPKGCRELDPAALPLEFLQVIADVKDKNIAKKQPLQQAEGTNNGIGEPADKDTALHTEKTK